MLLYFHTYVIWSLIHYPRDREQDPLHAHMTFIHFYDCRSDIEFFLWMSDSQIVAENEKIKSKTWFEWLSIQSEWKIRLLSLELLRPDLEWTKHVLELVAANTDFIQLQFQGSDDFWSLEIRWHSKWLSHHYTTFHHRLTVISWMVRCDTTWYPAYTHTRNKHLTNFTNI